MTDDNDAPRDGDGLREGGVATARRVQSAVRLRSVSRSLPFALGRAREAVMRHFRPALRAVDLTEQQWRVLRALGAVPEIDATGLAMATFILAPSLTRILKVLEDRRLIARRPDPADLRATLISLTGDGRTLLDRAGVEAERIYSALTARLGAERVERLLAMLKEIEADLDGPLDGALPPTTTSSHGRRRTPKP